MSAIDIAKRVLNLEAEGIINAVSLLDDSFNKIVDVILNCQDRVVITGMGKSGIIGKKIAATLASTGTRAFFVHPAEAYHGDLGMISDHDIIIAISNSGETEEVIKLLSFFKDNGNTSIAISANKSSTLVMHTDYFLNLGTSSEACPLELAPTTSTTVTLAIGDALAMAIMELRGFKEENFARFHPGGALGRKLLLKVKDIMHAKNLPTLSLEASFEEVIQVISKGMLGLSVVVDDNKSVKGIITDGDLRRVLESAKEAALSLRAKDFYTKNPITIDKDTKIIEAENIMNSKKISALIITKDNKLEGILHLYDI